MAMTDLEHNEVRACTAYETCLDKLAETDALYSPALALIQGGEGPYTVVEAVLAARQGMGHNTTDGFAGKQTQPDLETLIMLVTSTCRARDWFKQAFKQRAAGKFSI